MEQEQKEEKNLELKLYRAVICPQRGKLVIMERSCLGCEYFASISQDMDKLRCGYEKKK